MNGLQWTIMMAAFAQNVPSQQQTKTTQQQNKIKRGNKYGDLEGQRAEWTFLNGQEGEPDECPSIFSS
jgi:hypothetical protein